MPDYQFLEDKRFTTVAHHNPLASFDVDLVHRNLQDDWSRLIPQ
jgi:hypothetical protein